MPFKKGGEILTIEILLFLRKLRTVFQITIIHLFSMWDVSVSWKDHFRNVPDATNSTPLSEDTIYPYKSTNPYDGT